MSPTIVTFDKLTGEIDYDDEIVDVFEHDAVGHFTFEFDHDNLESTPEHRLWLGSGEFKTADDGDLSVFRALTVHFVRRGCRPIFL